MNTKVPSLKDQGKEYDGFTITITGDKYVFGGSNTLSNDEVLAIYLRKCHFYLHQVAFVFHWCDVLATIFLNFISALLIPLVSPDRERIWTVIVEFS